MTITCTFEEFKKLAKEFHDSAPTLNLEELDNAWKCLGLAYLGMSEPMWQHSAATLLKLEARTYSLREFDLENAPEVQQPKESSDAHKTTE